VEGLWNYIKKEFERKGLGKFYNKSAVKICTYSSFFQGGNKAMMEGILENERKKLGLSIKEFRNSSYYEEIHEMSKEITRQMMNSEIVLEFQELSRRIKEENLGDIMKSPTGQEFMISEENFKSCYPNYLQGFEMYLISQSTLNVKGKFETLEVIGHYHDGLVISVRKEDCDLIIEEFQVQIGKSGKVLGLTYNQSFEVQKIYRAETRDPNEIDSS
jgi:hypothetical protein